MLTIGSKIARLRRDHGWSQAELAKRVGVSASTIGAYETGRRQPDGNLLATLANALGTQLETLQETRQETLQKSGQHAGSADVEASAAVATPSIVTARAAEITGEVDLRVSADEAQILLAMRMNPQIREFVLGYTRATESERQQLERTLTLIKSFHVQPSL